jgi:ABC-type transport system substrate-binding protein
MKFTFKFFGLLLVISFIAFFPVLSQAQMPKAGGKLILGMRQDAAGMDPHKNQFSEQFKRFSFLYNGLLDYDKQGHLVPSLAISYNYSADQKELTLKLRPGVKFHNGKDLKAEDVKYSLDRVRDKKTASPLIRDFSSIQEIQVVDGMTVKITLKEVFAPFLSKLTLYYCSIIPVGTEAKEGTPPPGTGPFQFVEHKMNDYMRLKKFPQYWEKGFPYVDEIIFKPIVEDTVRYTSLRTGEIHWANTIPFPEVERALKNPPKDVVVLEGPTQSVFYFILNCSRPPFNNIKVRQAVALALDKKEIVAGAVWGRGETTDQAFGKANPFHLPVKPQKQDLNRARALLAEAGHPKGFKTTLPALTAHSLLLEMAKIAQAQLKKIGIEAELQLLEGAAFNRQVLVQKNFDITTMGDAGETRNDFDDAYYRAFFSTSPYNFAQYSNSAVDAWLQEGRRTFDLDKRKKIYTQVVDQMNQDAPIIYAIIRTIPYGWRTSLQGWEPNATSALCYSGGGFSRTWLEK